MFKLKLKTPASEPAAEESNKVKIKLSDESKEPSAEPTVPKISFNVSQPKAPKIKVKTKVSVEGYDSEAPDREEDPTIEEAIVLRMLPDESLDRLAQMCADNDFSKFSVKFLDPRRAVVSVEDELYAAQLLDLPTVTEVQKTFDGKNIYKSVDICQILLVTQKVSSEEEVLKVLSREPQPFQHGITPPLHNVRNRRFHQRISNKVIETIESKVDELFKKDAAAQDVQYELLDASAIEQQPGVIVSDEFSIDTNAHDMEEEEEEEEDDLDMADELEKVFKEDKDAKEDEDEDDEEDDDDDDEEDDLDEEQHDVRQKNKQLKQDIQDLQTKIHDKEQEANATLNKIIKGRLIDVVTRMKKELEVKTNVLQDAEEREESLAQSHETQNAANNNEDDEDDEDEDENEKLDGAEKAKENLPDTDAKSTADTPMEDVETAAGTPQADDEPMQDEEDDIDALF